MLGEIEAVRTTTAQEIETAVGDWRKSWAAALTAAPIVPVEALFSLGWQWHGLSRRRRPARTRKGLPGRPEQILGHWRQVCMLLLFAALSGDNRARLQREEHEAAISTITGPADRRAGGNRPPAVSITAKRIGSPGLLGRVRLRTEPLRHAISRRPAHHASDKLRCRDGRQVKRHPSEIHNLSAQGDHDDERRKGDLCPARVLPSFH
jgi:hypothetical protein